MDKCLGMIERMKLMILSLINRSVDIKTLEVL